MNDSYKSCVVAFCHNNLISLYLHVSESARHVTTDGRNAFVLKRLKAQLKRPENKIIKKEIKSMIVGAGKHDLEKQLINLAGIIEDNNYLADAESSWHELLMDLHQQTGFEIEPYNDKTEQHKNNTVFVLKDEIFDSIQSSGKVGTLSMFVASSSKEQQVTLIEYLSKLESDFTLLAEGIEISTDNKMLIRLKYTR
ncbi:hypothetical protein HNW13_018610 [Shewanella sp. BF02_Schw]|uniref:hypothetical protein n=1 Tax=Shewanella sp. BF02_Schw TaxID=394908 RepID=UPI00178028F9|nr:hypothetical protein [Shewanella sp. BF02_Schw]MBO1897754.1 hypothetical protein [Shewanella sp. BF02_Schw]